MQGANHYEVTNDFSLSFLACAEALKAFSAKYVFVKGKIVSLQAIVPSVGVIICRFSIQNLSYKQPLLSKFQLQLLQTQQCFLMCEFAKYLSRI